jgi:endonuclease/exonuclease/phosphatase family metal-dependent hydrolase
LVVATADRPGGLCVMTALRVDVIETSFSLLSKESWRPESAVSGATVRFGGDVWRVASMQLGTDAGERRRQLPALVSALSTGPTAPLIVGGNLNDGPGQPPYDEIAEHWPSCLDAPAAGPALFADPALSVVSCEHVGGAGGQPRGVLAVLSLG